MNSRHVLAVLCVSTLLSSCTTANNPPLVCSSTELRFSARADIQFWLVSDGLYIAKAALAECPFDHLNVADPNGSTAYKELLADIRGELLNDSGSPGVGTYLVQARGHIAPHRGADGPTIVVEAVRSFRQSPLPKDVESNLRSRGLGVSG